MHLYLFEKLGNILGVVEVVIQATVKAVYP